MKLQIVQLEAYDDAVSVRDRLAFVQTERVLLVWPTQAAILRRKLDLVLIQREAARRNTRLGLVTTEPDVLDAARDLNISTFGSVDAGQRAAHWKQPRNKVFFDRANRPTDAPDPYELRVIASRFRAVTARQRRTRFITRMLMIGVLALALLAITYLVLPGADVTLALAHSQIDTNVQLTADPSLAFVDVQRSRIPAAIVIIDAESQASIPTTGISDVPSTLASGTVIFTNQTNSEITVPTGTVLLSTGTKPAKFRTNADTLVPSGVGSTATATIQATNDTPGAAGNVDPNLIINIEGTLSRLLAVRNPAATQGGTVREQPIVTKADYQNVLIPAREKIRQAALSQFKLTVNQLVVPDSIQIVEGEPQETTYSAFVGDPAETLTLNLRAKVQAMIIDELPAHQAALASLSAKIPAGQRLVIESVSYSREEVRLTGDKQAILIMSAAGNVTAQFDVERARQRIAGLSLTEAQNVLNRDWLLDPRFPLQIQVYPALFGRLPLLPIRINIVAQG